MHWLIIHFTTSLNSQIWCYSSLHGGFHHHIVFTKFNLKFFWPPSYPLEVWHYKDANTNLIVYAIIIFSGNETFTSITMNKKVEIFNKFIINILSNFIRYDTVIYDDKNHPWTTNKTKNLVWQKNVSLRVFIKITKIIIYFKS